MRDQGGVSRQNSQIEMTEENRRRIIKAEQRSGERRIDNLSHLQ